MHLIVAPSRARELKCRKKAALRNLMFVAPSRARELKFDDDAEDALTVESRPHGRVS